MPNSMQHWTVAHQGGSDWRVGLAGIDGEEVWGGGEVGRPDAHCCSLLIENKKNVADSRCCTAQTKTTL